MAMTLRLPPELDAALRETAEREGRSLHETVVVALQDYTSRRIRERDESIERMLRERKSVFDRLA